jgi:hypothetical protein
MQELEVIARATGVTPTIVIDDARCFDGTNDYPTTRQVTDYLRALLPKHALSIQNDAIVLTPSEQ